MCLAELSGMRCVGAVRTVRCEGSPALRADGTCNARVAAARARLAPGTASERAYLMVAQLALMSSAPLCAAARGGAVELPPRPRQGRGVFRRPDGRWPREHSQTHCTYRTDLAG